jgi:hypothetical protein
MFASDDGLILSSVCFARSYSYISIGHFGVTAGRRCAICGRLSWGSNRSGPAACPRLRKTRKRSNQKQRKRKATPCVGRRLVLRRRKHGPAGLAGFQRATRVVSGKRVFDILVD